MDAEKILLQCDEQRLYHLVEQQDSQLEIRIVPLSRCKEEPHRGEAATQVKVREAERDQPSKDCSRRRPFELGDACCRFERGVAGGEEGEEGGERRGFG